MRKSNIQQLTLAAMVAAVYFVWANSGTTFNPPSDRFRSAWGRR